MKNTLFRRVITSAVAVVTAAGLALSSSPAASAALPFPLPPAPKAPAGAKQIVTFGDSFTAIGGTVAGQAPQLEQGYQFKPTCAKELRNWPHVAAKVANKSLADWSCNGTGGMIPVLELRAYVNQAIQAGNIGPGTEKVAIMYGGMDAVQWFDVAAGLAGLGNLGPTVFQNLYADIKRDVAQAAPGAQVVILGYPEFVMNDKLCFINPDANNPIPVPTPGGDLVQNNLRDSIKRAAHVNGLKFIDTLEFTRGHGTCAPRPEDRWVIGLFDPAVPSTMPQHPSINGAIQMGKIIGRELYR